MTAIPKKLRADLTTDPFYATCCRKGLFGHECAGRVTWEHAVQFAGRRLNTRWAILPVCARGHEVDKFQDGGEEGSGDLDKEVHLWIALNRATDAELEEVSKAVDYVRLRAVLNRIYGVYKESVPEGAGINY